MSELSIDRTGLERTFGRIVVVFTLSLLGIALGLATLEGLSLVLRWSVPTATVGFVVLAYCYTLRDHAQPTLASRKVFGSLGVANHVTVARGGLFVAVTGFAALEPTRWIGWLPALLYGAGSALDWVDGFLARMNGRTTVLGAKLDIAFDSLGFVVGPVVAVVWGRLPVWYLSLSLARYLFLAGKAWRRRRGLPVFDLPESRLRRPLAGFQMAFITFALAPLVQAEMVHTLAVIALPPSLLVFLRDYLVVAGRVGGAEQY